jgi:uncharacterized damage-inducible protein DinB
MEVADMTSKEILALFHYDEWATKRTIDSVSSLPEEKYKRDLKSSHGSIHGTLVHMYGAAWIWLERWKGNTPPAPFNVDQILDLSVLNDRWVEYRQSLDAYLPTVDDGKLSAASFFTDNKGNRRSDPLYQQMLQVVNHGSYHRGQVVTMLRQLGEKPQATDLMLYYRTAM